MDDSDFIISRPDEQGLLRKTLFATLTGLAWLGWVYLWLPLLTLLAWWIGIDRAWKHLVTNNSESNLYDIRLLLGIACTCAATALSWMVYNRWLFGRLKRRRAVVNTINEEIALKLGSNRKMAVELRRNRHSVLYIDDAGNPFSVDSEGHWVLGTDHEHGYDSRPLHSQNDDEAIIDPDNL